MADSSWYTLYIKHVAKGKVSNLCIQIVAICKRNNNLFVITKTYIHSNESTIQMQQLITGLLLVF